MVLKRLQSQLSRKVKRIRAEYGGEYVNAQIAGYLEDNGIVHEKTIPYSPQQNGRAERLNKTLVERSRCILAESGLYLRDLSPSSHAALTPN